MNRRDRASPVVRWLAMALDITVQRTDHPRPREPESTLGFGRVFTDHMLTMEWTVGRGWGRASIQPYAPLQLDPAASVLHYGQAMFEGMKAFRGADGIVRLWRLMRHCQRMQAGSPRLCMPHVPPEDMAQAIEALVRVDADWVPSAPESALYIRPTMIATEGFLGVRPAERYLFFVILSPVGAYYGDGALTPVRIFVERTLTRAAPGGLGAAKAAANYAAGLYAAVEARKAGYAQVLWLDGVEHRYIEEVGTMNLFVVIGDELVTAPLSDSILAGVTRDCVLTLAREWGVTVSERKVAIDEIVAAHRAGTLREVFGSGTAAVVSPVGELSVDGEALIVNANQPGPLSLRLYEEITGIQRGVRPDRYGWLTPVV
jgi:branched-chain amino acid aminotransferase